MQTRSKLRLLQQAVVQIPIQESYIIRISPIGENGHPNSFFVGGFPHEYRHWRNYCWRKGILATSHRLISDNKS